MVVMVLNLLLMLAMVGAMVITVLLLRLLHMLHLAEVLTKQVDRGIRLADCVLVVPKPLLLVLRVSLATIGSPGLHDATSGLGSLVSTRCG